MPTRGEVDAAAATMTLGKIADDALRGLVKMLEGRDLETRERDALRFVRDLLTAVAEVRSGTVALPMGLKFASSAEGLDEAVEAVSEAQDGHQQDAQELAQAVDLILDGRSENESFSRVEGFLERLAEVTLVRTDEIAHRASTSWIPTA